MHMLAVSALCLWHGFWLQTGRQDKRIMDTAIYLKVFCLAVTGCLALHATAQEVWGVDRCMAYAVDHNHTVKQRRLEADNYELDRLQAIGNFLPGVSGSTGVQYSFGRSVDPETNTYNNVSTFNNSYALEASLTLFRGGSLVNELRRSRAAVLLGKAALQEARDNTALETFQAYIDALYYYGTERLARRKLAESDSLLYKTRRQEELGLKGMADVAQMEAQQAADTWNLTRQRNLFRTAMLTLKQRMNYPAPEPLPLDTCLLDADAFSFVRLSAERPEDVAGAALSVSPTLRRAEMNRRIALMRRKGSWANILPQITLFGGVSSSYYKELHRDGYDSFGRQFRNNLGQYFGVSMSVPLFGRFSGVVGMRRARNDWRIAQEQYEEQKAELRKLVIQAVNDREGCLRETVQMQKKVASDSLAYRVTRRKYEEGLMTSLDVQNSAATLFESETLLLQSKLTYLLKCRLVDYYKGKTIINEQLTINN